MKKLGKLSISEDKMMKNEELINLRGGELPYGTCAWSGYGEWGPQCNIPKSYAEYWANLYGGHWCCDSCGDGTYDEWYRRYCG